MEVNKYTFPVRKDNWRRLFPELFEIRIHDNDIQKLAMALGRTRSVQELVVSTLLPRTLTVLTLRHKNVSYSKYAAVWCNSLRNFWPKFLWVSLRNVHETKFDIPLVNGFRDTVRWLFFNHASVRWWECYARRLKSTFSFLLLDEIQHHLLYIKIGNSKDSRGPTSVSQNRKSLIQYYLFNLIRGNLVSWKCGDWVCCHLPPLQWTCGPSQLEVVTQLASGKTSPGNLGPAEFVPRMPWAFPGWDMTICWRRPLRLNDPTDVWWWRLLSGSQKISKYYIITIHRCLISHVSFWKLLADSIVWSTDDWMLSSGPCLWLTKLWL